MSPIRILHLEDNALDAALIARALATSRLDCHVALADRLPLYQEAVQQGEFDLVLADNGFPGYSGLDALAAAREHRPMAPFICVSGSAEPERVRRLLEAGADDYVTKDAMWQVAAAVHRAVKQIEVQQRITALERRLADSTRQIADIDREVEALARAVSHDLRAPLRSAGGFANILEADYADRLSADGQLCARRIVEGVGNVFGLTDDLARLAKVAGAPLERTRVDLTALAREHMRDLAAASPERSIEFDCTEGLVAHGDPTQMRLVVENLLSNAWKYTGRRLHASVLFGAERSAYGPPVFYVRDNGAGFDEKLAGRLFAPFQRLHHPYDFPGNGIGLAIARRIVHRHGGRIWAQATVGRGATFFFTLPETA